jgi:hypothetical protein
MLFLQGLRVAARQRNKKLWDCTSTQPYQWLHMFEKPFIGSYSTSSRLWEAWIHKLSHSKSTSEKADKANLLDPSLPGQCTGF